MAQAIEVSDIPTPIGTFRVVYQGARFAWSTSSRTACTRRACPGGRVPPQAAVPRREPAPAASGVLPGPSRRFRGRRGPGDRLRFDRTVWSTLLRAVRAGRTVTYGELARRAGFPGSARAVGGAMARNPIPIVIPCHRVVGQGGSITGFGLGLWRKRWLLDHEGAWPIRSRSAEGPRPRGQRTLDGSPVKPPRRPSDLKATTRRS